MKESKEMQFNRSFLIIIIAGLFAYYLGLVNMYIWVFVLFVLLRHFNREEVGFFSLLFGTGLFGRMIPSKEIYLFTVVFFTLLGIILLLDKIIYVIRKHSHSVFFFIIVWLFFMIAFFLGPHTDYSYVKISKASPRFFLWLVAFLIYVESNQISNKRIGLAYLILTLFYLSECGQLYGVKPSSLFDTTFFRDYCTLIGRDENNTSVVNYHTLSYLSLASIVFWTLNADFLVKNKTNTYLIAIVSFWIIAISGTRQAVFVFGVLAVIRYIESKRKTISASNIMKILLFAFIFVSIVSLLGSSYYETALNSDAEAGERLHRDTVTPFLVMAIDPVWGIGFGGYPLYANKDYPHNFFVEMICEEGFIGLITFLIVIFLFVVTNKNKNYFRYQTKNGSYLFMLFMLFFTKAQISGDLTSSVSFIAILFSFVVQKSLKKVTC